MKERKYGKYFLTEPALRNKPKIEMSNPSAYVDSKSHFGAAANFSMAWRYIKEPMLFDRIPHYHDFDEFLCFLGGNLEDIFDFDATIELSLGEEEEIYLIEQPTVVYIPAGLVHTPLTFKRIDKPVLFHPIPLTPDYYSNFGERVKFYKKRRE
jgi:mannose-6-phosphate isomerase-like protein (cupin superfamily)